MEQHHCPCYSQGLGDTGEPETPEQPACVVTESQQSEPGAGLFRQGERLLVLVLVLPWPRCRSVPLRDQQHLAELEVFVYCIGDNNRDTLMSAL